MYYLFNLNVKLVKPRKKNPLSRLRHGIRSKWSSDDSGPFSSSSRFLRLFNRDSRDKLYEVGENALQTENEASEDTSLGKSVPKSLSFSSLFGRQRRVESETCENDGQKSGRPHTRHPLTILAESPTQGESKFSIKNRLKSKLFANEPNSRPANQSNISVPAPTGDNESRKFFLIKAYLQYFYL
ncbi:unnamed protein product [Rodentolepis nana]|uniref:Myelin basic protein n=1 Tax=Rodentolepis nana TaxID=102285 RepID=A0A0R3TFK2_RODNA|nr:unnamed protein product [Rodentolepis nana]